jgi:hypothetical protein
VYQNMNENSNMLFLDDIRNPVDVLNYINNPMYKEYWNVVRNYDQFVEYIEKNGIPDVISFDHDLADEHYRPSMYNPDGHYSGYYTDGTFTEKTGYDCAKWLIEYCMEAGIDVPTTVLVHSMNPIGKLNIISLFNTYNKIKTLL